MRILLKILAICMLIVTIAAAGIVLYVAETRVPGIDIVQSQAIPASRLQDAFKDLQGQLDAGTFSGHVFVEGTEPEMDRDTFLNLTLRLQNRCLLPMEWIEATVIPEEGDILEERDARPRVLAAGSQGDVPLRILTENGENLTRRVRVQYYLLGKLFETETQVIFDSQKAEDEQV